MVTQLKVRYISAAAKKQRSQLATRTMISIQYVMQFALLHGLIQEALMSDLKQSNLNLIGAY